jgi:glucose/arabinose dehydrogenase
MRSVIIGMLAWLSAGAAIGQDVRRLWIDQCARCHGGDGEGGSAGTLLDADWAGDAMDSGLFASIRDGMEDLGMPAYGGALEDNEIWALTVYIRELRARHEREATPWRRPEDGVFRADGHSYRIETVVGRGLDTPWSVELLPDGRMLVSERGGSLRVVSADGVRSPSVRGTPAVWTHGQGGLLDVGVHPGFAENGWVYLSYADSWEVEGDRVGMTRVVRGRIVDGAWVDERTIFEAPAASGSPAGVHFGTRLVFADGMLYFGIGDRGRDRQAQDLSRPNGKIHRVRDDGAIPEDNPFVGTRGALGSIWSLGHRNPQGLTLDAAGRLWETEHGPRGGDELNLIERGGNYGWPVVSFGINYNGAPLVTPWPEEGKSITMPRLVWTPSIAACGLDVVRGGAFPAWSGDLVAGGLAGEIVERVRVDAEGRVVWREVLLRDAGRVRDVRVGPDGLIYVVLNGPDAVVRMVPVGTEPGAGG